MPSLPSAHEATGARPPIPEFLLALAPRRMPNRRRARYLGDTLFVSLEDLAERDRFLLRNLYKVLTSLLYAIVDPATDDAGKWRDVLLWTQNHSIDEIISEVRELGLASHQHAPNEDLAKAIHDLRGGALSALLGRLQLLERLPHTEDQLKTLFVLTRDHLKIMRNAIVGLDEPRRNGDRKPKSHNMLLMVEKWHDSVVGPKWRERPIRMTVDCRYAGALTECCLESAAVDRIFYNLANNACRHAATERLDMVIFPVSEPQAECLRFVLSNEVGEEDAAYLRSLETSDGAGNHDRGTGVNLLKLFEPKVSSTGSGFGLTVVAEFVAEAFGLRSRKEALRERYVGAVLDGRTFRIWFHWPMANGALPPKLDDFHHPEKSLSEA